MITLEQAIKERQVFWNGTYRFTTGRTTKKEPKVVDIEQVDCDDIFRPVLTDEGWLCLEDLFLTEKELTNAT